MIPRTLYQYIYFQPVEVSTDHKPLEEILMKRLSAAPQPLQRMMLRLQKYDLNVLHKHGKEMPVAETLSRLHGKHTDDTHESFDTQVHKVMANPLFSDKKILQLKSKTRDEPALQQLIRIVKVGRRNHRGQCPK